MQQNYFRLFLFLYAALSFFSCKKDTDESNPTITIITPVENQSFNVNDVVWVKASVSDDTKITAASISLLDDQQRVSHRSLSVPVSSPSTTINAAYTLDNIHLESGFYYILITATDGKNDSRMYRRIYIAAVPKVIEKVFVVSHTSSSQTNLSYIDSSFSSVIPYHTCYGDYTGSSISSYYQQVYACGNFTGSFTGIRLKDNSIRFSISPLVSSSPYFTGFYGDEQDNYVARYDGFIQGYDYFGNIIYGTMAGNGYYAMHIYFNSKYMITEEKNKSSSEKKLVTYYPNGNAQQSVLINQDIVTFCEKDEDEVFLFGNDSGQGVIQLFDRTHNYIWNPYFYSLPVGTILSAVKINQNTYLIGHSDGTIYKYEYSNSSLTTYISGYTAIQLRYDSESNRLYVAEANRISSFDYTFASALNFVNTNETILDLHLLYNR